MTNMPITEAVDQIFVRLTHWIVGWFPAWLQPWLLALIAVAAIVVLYASLFAVTTLLERKGLGRFQNRYGPNRAGPWGVLQPIADAIKSLTKEDIVPHAADKAVHFLAPVMMVAASFMGLAVIPAGRNMTAINVDAGVLYFFAAGSVMELTVFMAGWSSLNKYSLLGAMRAIAQMLSYEIPLILSALTVIMAAGSLSTVEIVNRQAVYTATLPHWFVFTPWGFAGFLLFMIAAIAETNRSPFDLPEGESEIIAGYLVEYSGFKFALFFMGEYIGMFSISGMAITLFLGGWAAPFSFLAWIPSWFWFFAKLIGMICLLIWVRATLPRFRMDQLMHLAWQFMLPMALINLVVVAVWRFMTGGIMGLLRWPVCLVLILVPYILLGRGLQAKRLVKREYKFAE